MITGFKGLIRKILAQEFPSVECDTSEGENRHEVSLLPYELIGSAIDRARAAGLVLVRVFICELR